MDQLSNGDSKRNKIWHKCILRDEDDARTSNTCMALKKRAIPNSMMKTNGNIIECCNNTHQGAPHIGKQMSACTLDLGDGSMLLVYNIWQADSTDCIKIGI